MPGQLGILAVSHRPFHKGTLHSFPTVKEDIFLKKPRNVPIIAGDFMG
jgi:hypothetical protein